jgi:hypothetical protein
VELERALAIEDETERMLGVVGVITEAVRDLGVRPIIVGGLDEELASWKDPVTAAALEVQVPGAVRRSRDARVTAGRGSGERARSGRTCGGGRSPGRNSGCLAQPRGCADVRDGNERGRLLGDICVACGDNRERLRERASQEQLTNAVEAIERLARRSEAGERFETWELHEIARELRRPTLNR